MLSILMATAATTSPLSAASLDQHMAAIYEEKLRVLVADICHGTHALRGVLPQGTRITFAPMRR